MIGEKPLIIPEVHKPLETQSLQLSADTALGSVQVAQDLARGQSVSAEHAKVLTDGIIKDFSVNGFSLTEDEKTKWGKDVVRRISGKDVEAPRKLVEMDKPVDPFDFKKVSETMDKLVQTYQLDSSVSTWKTVAGTMSGNAMLDNIWGGIRRNLFGTTEKSRHFFEKFNVLLTDLPTGGAEKDWTNVRLTELKGKHFGAIAAALVKHAWPIWAPFVADYPQSWLQKAALKRHTLEMGKLQEKVNDRIAQSIIMREYKYINDKSPTEIMTTINRGKQATLELVDTVYTQLIPTLAEVGTFPLKVIRSWPEALLAIAKIPSLMKESRLYANDMLAAKKTELEQFNKVNSRILSTLGSLESIKTSDSMDTASSALKQSMISRDFIRRGGLRTPGRAETTDKKLFRYLDIGVPTVQQGYNMWLDWQQMVRQKLFALGVIQRDKLSPSKLRSIKKQKKFIQDIKYPEKLTQKQRTRLHKKLEGLQKHTLTPSEQAILDGFGLRPDVGTFLLTSAGEAYYNIVDAKAQQDFLQDKFMSLAELYVDRILPLLDDIQKMEDLLGPYDRLDTPTGPKEAKRVPVSNIKRFDIRADHIDFGTILKDVSLDIPQGSFVTVKGASGLGKTTFMRHLLGLFEGDGGAVTYGGVKVGDIKKYGSESIYSKIGYATQHTEFFESKTLRENLVDWTRRDVSDEEITRVLTDLRLDTVISRLDSTAKHYSGGELRRIGIARALLKNPAILFLDEPTANLDQASAEQVMNIIQDLRKKRPEMTVIAITHDPAFENIAEQVIDFAALNKRKPGEDVSVEIPKLSDHQVLEAIARANN